ncbi:hypothetical protein [Pseudovibrio sp. Tun.PSC04-5.I4]|uniref:hypothetical protein n=1 Tax=Pseudovibrio sp. Tun.PSC04-5.I4 TaxID=1798213 RepID=UPI00087ECC4F|nr:hypothetical protein [Pseudovibrio sp. Tun.PSC04-5.I4]SDQ28665.1 hypothetical protein SAMN04515695_0712 [Pseudovibrio sp. Tun.PSC04-5.I4]SDQ29640.1 hypothetical protein SAMN04515695_0758 [Pseudovibrio sp. Tun.PSC04-5.I4]SDR44721.1 hypothetical protein SAMN04515695_5443 [Pseudovibrio sp. Tun.PSC04-5.I4]SDR45789.1 hypothetical protein SAMN04515695_5638 [Pseudovibrio sp. Tun.PSC04-5.I4]
MTSQREKHVRITPRLSETLEKEMLKACRKIAETHGLEVEQGGKRLKSRGDAFEMVLRVKVPVAEGQDEDLDKELFELLCSRYGLKKENYGEIFSDGEERFRIAGLDTRRPKYPISAKRISDGRLFKFSPEQVRVLLQSIAKVR